MDYAQSLREEREKAHSIFHSVVLELTDFGDSVFLAFFEGEDDPSFYLPHLRARCEGREYKSYICNGRGEVLTVLRLLEADGRAISRSMFFIDKDHNDLLGTIVVHRQLLQTEFYSIENYLVDPKMFLTYWVEILHLDATDKREKNYLDQFDKAYVRFAKRMQTLMAIILLGQGIDGHPPRKLNLNNVNLDLIFEINFENSICCYKSGAGKHFAVASNSIEYLAPGAFFNRRKEIKAIINTHLKGREGKEFIRGKYEFWFFVKFIQKTSAKLSSKAEAKLTGLKRATPKIQITHDTALEVLAPRLCCPDRLATFLNEFLNNHSDQSNVDSFVLS